jgi:predicted transcriptional regulator
LVIPPCACGAGCASAIVDAEPKKNSVQAAKATNIPEICGKRGSFTTRSEQVQQRFEFSFPSILLSASCKGTSSVLATETCRQNRELIGRLLIRQENRAIVSHPFPQKTRKWMGHADSIELLDQ